MIELKLVSTYGKHTAAHPNCRSAAQETKTTKWLRRFAIRGEAMTKCTELAVYARFNEKRSEKLLRARCSMWTELRYNKNTEVNFKQNEMNCFSFFFSSFVLLVQIVSANTQRNRVQRCIERPKTTETMNDKWICMKNWQPASTATTTHSPCTHCGLRLEQFHSNDGIISTLCPKGIGMRVEENWLGMDDKQKTCRKKHTTEERTTDDDDDDENSAEAVPFDRLGQCAAWLTLTHTHMRSVSGNGKHASDTHTHTYRWFITNYTLQIVFELVFYFARRQFARSAFCVLFCCCHQLLRSQSLARARTTHLCCVHSAHIRHIKRIMVGYSSTVFLPFTASSLRPFIPFTAHSDAVILAFGSRIAALLLFFSLSFLHLISIMSQCFLKWLLLRCHYHRVVITI